MSRVVIRPPLHTDRDAFIDAMEHSRELHHPWIAVPATAAEYATYVQRNADPAVECFIACRLEDGAIAGFLNLSEIVRGKLQQAFLGYGGVAGFEGQGYMSESMHLVRACVRADRPAPGGGEHPAGPPRRSRSPGGPDSRRRGSRRST